MLASNINLLTHYAKGTLSLFIETLFELLIKLLIHSFPSRYFFTIAYISYLALEEGSPCIQTGLIRFTYFNRLLYFNSH